jgi:hypothetical protein
MSGSTGGDGLLLASYDFDIGAQNFEAVNAPLWDASLNGLYDGTMSPDSEQPQLLDAAGGPEALNRWNQSHWVSVMPVPVNEFRLVA